MTRGIRSRRRRGWRAILAIAAVVVAASIPSASTLAAEPDDMVLRWNNIAIQAIGNPVAPPAGVQPGLGQVPPLAPIQLAIVHTAIYDAVNAIDGGHQPYNAGLSAPAGASKAAAVVTAAYDSLAVIAASSPTVLGILATARDSSLSEIDAGTAKDQGITIGHQAAEAMRVVRLNDGRTGSGLFATGTDPGEWRTVPPVSNNVFQWVKDIKTFALKSSSQLTVEPPPALTSPEYAADFNEVKALGRQTNSSRTQAQFMLASFVSANVFPFANRGLRDIATAQGLDTVEQARLFAMTSMAAADALITCWYNKDHYLTWRPQTAIQEAASDGNPATTADPDWKSLNPTPGYPDLPSGYNCINASTFYAARLYFGTDKMSFSLTSPGVAQALPNIPIAMPGSTRNYTRFSDAIRDGIDGRILNGLHFRHADVAGAWIGKKAAQWVEKHYFEPVD
jgi:hypothetical protein